MIDPEGLDVVVGPCWTLTCSLDHPALIQKPGAVVDPDLLKFQQKQKKSGWDPRQLLGLPYLPWQPAWWCQRRGIFFHDAKGRSGKGNKIYSMDRGRYVKAEGKHGKLISLRTWQTCRGRVFSASWRILMIWGNIAVKCFCKCKAMLPKGGDTKSGKIALDATLRNVGCLLSDSSLLGQGQQ